MKPPEESPGMIIYRQKNNYQLTKINSAYSFVRNVQSFICFQNKPVSELESFFFFNNLYPPEFPITSSLPLQCKVHKIFIHSYISPKCFQPFISLLFQRDIQIHTLKRNFKYSNIPILMFLMVFQSSSHKNKIFKNVIMSLIKVHTSVR